MMLTPYAVMTIYLISCAKILMICTAATTDGIADTLLYLTTRQRHNKHYAAPRRRKKLKLFKKKFLTLTPHRGIMSTVEEGKNQTPH